MRLLSTCLAALITFSSTLAMAATLVVTSTADSGPGTLREAIALAADGDEIVIDVTGTIEKWLTVDYHRMLMSEDEVRLGEHVVELFLGRKTEPSCKSGKYRVTVEEMGLENHIWEATPEQAGQLQTLFPDATVQCQFGFGTGPADSSD